MKKNTRKFESIGFVAVDSGQLILCDPCYIDSEWDRVEFEEGKHLSKFNYSGASNATLSNKRAGQLNFKHGHPGAGVVFSTAWGDGTYEVFARRDKDGRIVEVKVKTG